MPELLECTACGAAVPGGAFCSVCGRPLVAAPQPVEQETPSPAPPAGSILPAAAPASPFPLLSRTHRRRALAAGAVVVAAAGAWLLHEAPHPLEGDIAVVDDYSYRATDGESCTASGGYDDIATGRQVVVEDESGTVLATSVLGPGRADGGQCVFPFSFEDVGTAKFYEVTTGNSNRGGLRYSIDELESADWTVHLSLGD